MFGIRCCRVSLRSYLKRLRSSVAAHSYPCHPGRRDARRELARARAIWRRLVLYTSASTPAPAANGELQKNFLQSNSGTVNTYTWPISPNGSVTNTSRVPSSSSQSYLEHLDGVRFAPKRFRVCHHRWCMSANTSVA